MFASLSIRARLFISYSVLLGLLLSVTALALHRLDELTATTQEIVDLQGQRVALAQQVNQHSQSAAIRLLTLLQTPERDKRVPLYTAMDQEIAALDGAVEALEKLPTPSGIDTETRTDAGTGAGTGSGADIRRLVELRQHYGERFQATVELIERDGPLAARRHFESATQASLDQLLDETLALTTRQQQSMAEQLQQLNGDAAEARRLIVYLAIVVLILGAGSTLIISRGIVRPLRDALAVAEAIAAGDYRRAIPTGQNDEVGALLRALTVMRDSISSREEKIARLAYVDTLTGLPNRTWFFERFASLPTGSSGAIAVLNIDRFAPINAALGHEVGDRLLKEIGQRLQQATEAPRLMARVWGDEFAFLLEGANRAAAEDFVNHMLTVLRAPMSIDDQRLDIDGTFGIALYPANASDALNLLRCADAAMLQAKQRHDAYACGDSRCAEPAYEQLSLIGEMRDALANSEFVIHYQPKLKLAENRITSAEALIRWRHPDKGMIAPMRFIPFAEQTGFITKITPWVLRQVIADAANWRAAGVTVVASVNLSAYDLLSHELVLEILRLLEQYGLPAEQLCLEITESALMNEPERALQNLHELSAHGLKLSIDDYGSGQASLGYVKTLPVNELKIDRVFITDIDREPKNAAIVRSTVLLCRELGLSVVAEGAETAAELAWLADAGCDLIQGYGVAKPMPLETFLPWVEDFNRRA